MSRPIYIVIYVIYFSFFFIFILINPIISLKQTHLFFAYFLEYVVICFDDNADEESK